MHTDMGSRVILSPILLLIALIIYIKIYAKFIRDTVTIKADICDIIISIQTTDKQEILGVKITPIDRSGAHATYCSLRSLLVSFQLDFSVLKYKIQGILLEYILEERVCEILPPFLSF